MAIPTVSIGLPVYNGAKYLEGTLKQLLSQDYEDFELVISNNASTDNTEEICLQFAASDKRIRYSKNETNIGATPNWNKVFQLSRGSFFKWAMHDDECDTALISRCMERYKTASVNTVLVFPRGDIIDGNSDLICPSPDRLAHPSRWAFRRLARVLFRVDFAHPLWGVIRSDALRKARPAGCIEADLVLLADLSLQGELVELPEVLYRMRRHPGNATEINKTERSLMSWYDPNAASKRIVLPHWEMVYLEYFRCIKNAHLPFLDKLLSYATVPAVGYYRRTLRWSGPLRHRFGIRRPVTRALAAAA